MDQTTAQEYIDAGKATVSVYEPDDEWAGYENPATPPAEPLSVTIEDPNGRVAVVGSKPELVALFTAALDGLAENESDYLPAPGDDQADNEPDTDPSTETDAEDTPDTEPPS